MEEGDWSLNLTPRVQSERHCHRAQVFSELWYWIMTPWRGRKKLEYMPQRSPVPHPLRNECVLVEQSSWPHLAESHAGRANQRRSWLNVYNSEPSSVQRRLTCVWYDATMEPCPSSDVKSFLWRWPRPDSRLQSVLQLATLIQDATSPFVGPLAQLQGDAMLVSRMCRPARGCHRDCVPPHQYSLYLSNGQRLRQNLA